jgi:hypothetical protein
MLAGSPHLKPYRVRRRGDKQPEFMAGIQEDASKLLQAFYGIIFSSETQPGSSAFNANFTSYYKKVCSNVRDKSFTFKNHLYR